MAKQRASSDKLGRSISLQNYKNIQRRYSTVNAENFKTIEIECKSFFTPVDLRIDYKELVKKIEKKIKGHIYFLGNPFFRKECIVDLSLITSGLGYDNRTYFCLEVLLYVKEYFDLKSPETQLMVNDISTKILDEFILDDNVFTFYIKKHNR